MRGVRVTKKTENKKQLREERKKRKNNKKENKQKEKKRREKKQNRRKQKGQKKVSRGNKKTDERRRKRRGRGPRMAMAFEQVRVGRRSEKPVGIQVTDRDRELMGWINGHGFATVAQVGRWMGVHYQTAQRRVQLLVAHGYLQSAWVLHGEPRAIWPTKLGWRLSGDGLSPVRQMSPGVYRHDRMVVDISQTILAKNPGARFVPARRLRRKLWQDNPDVRPSHVSDGVIMFPNGHRLAIELELTAKNRTALEKIILDHAADLEIDQVWYFVMDGSVRRLVARLIEGQEIFSIHDWRDEVS